MHTALELGHQRPSRRGGSRPFCTLAHAEDTAQ
jgi:hypothetical protein